jgi:hypothetical protein
MKVGQICEVIRRDAEYGLARVFRKAVQRQDFVLNTADFPNALSLETSVPDPDQICCPTDELTLSQGTGKRELRGRPDYKRKGADSAD